jgi:death-on-curing protein
MAAVIAMHAELISEHGGLRGPPRLPQLIGTLDRPRQLFRYGKPADRSLERLAACYAFGLARSHCFPDGNKRISLVTLDVFLALNGYELRAGEPEAAVMIDEIAAGKCTEEDLALWVAGNLQPANAG